LTPVRAPQKLQRLFKAAYAISICWYAPPTGHDAFFPRRLSRSPWAANVRRAPSSRALATEEKLLACITTKGENVTGDDAKPSDLYKIGTIVNIKRMMRAEGVMQLIVQGLDRFEIVEWTAEQPYLKAKVHILPDLRRVDDEEIEALKRNIQGMIQQALALLPQSTAGDPRRRNGAGGSRSARILSRIGPRSRHRD